MARADLDKGLLRVVPIALVVVASAWFAFAALWGIFGLNGAGHLGGGSTGTAMAAEQMVKWHIWYPAGDWYSGLPPPKTEYNCHHPFGVYWATALFLAVFGHRDFVVHAAPALMSAFMPWLLYAIAKQAWGRAVGAVCACAFAVVPIAIGFSAYNNLEVMTMFGAALFFLGHARHQASPRFRNLILSA